MHRTSKKPRAIPRHEHSVPWFWPLAAGIELGETGFRMLDESLKFVVEAAKIDYALEPRWTTPNHIRVDLDTLRLRDFSLSARGNSVPVLIDPPYAGHTSTIADFAHGQTLVGTLRSAGLDRVFVADWKSATASMQYYDIDKYLAEINVVVDELGGHVDLIGLCQGGWMCAMYAARFPAKVRTLVLAGAPIDTAAGHGPIRDMARRLPPAFFRNLVQLGGGRMLGRVMLAGWKGMHPDRQYVEKYIDLYAHIEDRNYLERTERFERWFENTVDLPGVFYLQAIEQLFQQNRLARGTFVALGQQVDLRRIAVPLFLLAAEDDDITPPEQVFRAEALVGTAATDVAKALTPGGHIGLFMSRQALANVWPRIGAWIRAQRGERMTPVRAAAR